MTSQKAVKDADPYSHPQSCWFCGKLLGFFQRSFWKTFGGSTWKKLTHTWGKMQNSRPTETQVKDQTGVPEAT